MKRATKPPTPPLVPVRDDASSPRRPRAAGRSGTSGASGEVAVPAVVDEELPLAIDDLEEDLSEAETPHCLEQSHVRGESSRPPEPTVIVGTPAIEWEPEPLATHSSGQTYPAPPPAFSTPPRQVPAAGELPAANRSMEASLRDQIWSGLESQPAPYAPIATPQPFSSGSRLSTTTGSYPSTSGQREIVGPRSGPTPLAMPPERMPIGYVIASAFFLAIAVTGFGLWLAFEVISL